MSLLYLADFPLAWELLESEGYRLVTKNHHGDGGEVDVIAWEGDVLCFVEVRSRADDSFGDPLETIDRRKIKRIGRAAYHFLSTFEEHWPVMRFDAVGVTLTDPPKLRLVKDAFEL
ncbi:MAG: YraN family protein [Myxococcota bacterium]